MRLAFGPQAMIGLYLLVFLVFLSPEWYPGQFGRQMIITALEQHTLLNLECSQHFVDVIAEHRKSLAFESIKPCVWSDADRASLSALSKSVIDSVATQFDITSTNRIKPGIAEATRAVLRRVPDHVLIKDLNDPDVQLLIHLAESAGVQVTPKW